MGCSRNLDLETLIARDSWASVEEMEMVIPFHAPNFKRICEKSVGNADKCSISELAFTTRFVATFLFLRVKCARPMTFQYITLEMVEVARTNGGFIDQTQFKTAATYTFDTLIISEEVINVLDCYISYVRPFLNPVCNYLLVSTVGKQYTSFSTAMTLLVKEAIGKYINPTRYRQIIETESSTRLTLTEQEIISKDQKHSSDVAKRFYRKNLSRDIATKGKMCIEKMVGNSRTHDEKQLSNLLSTINNNKMLFDQSVFDHTEEVLGASGNPILSNNITDETPSENATSPPNENSGRELTSEVIITGNVEAPSLCTDMDNCETTTAVSFAPFDSNDVAFQKLPEGANVETSSPNSPSLLLDHGLISDTKNLCASYSTTDVIASQTQKNISGRPTESMRIHQQCNVKHLREIN